MPYLETDGAALEGGGLQKVKNQWAEKAASSGWGWGPYCKYEYDTTFSLEVKIVYPQEKINSEIKGPCTFFGSHLWCIPGPDSLRWEWLCLL